MTGRKTSARSQFPTYSHYQLAPSRIVARQFGDRSVKFQFNGVKRALRGFQTAPSIDIY